MKLDVTNFSDVQKLVQETGVRTGRLDYLFNNAGIGINGNIEHYDIDDWKYILDINLRGVIHGVQAAYKVMKAQGFGHIVNTASMAGLTPCPGMVSYAATKHGVVGLSTSLRAEAAPLGINVSVLCPGFVRTAILEDGGKYGRVLFELSPEQKKHIWAMVERFKPMAPDLFAKKALDLVAKNRAIIIVPSWWKWVWCIHRAFPSLGLSLAQRSFQNMQKKLGLV